MRDDSTFSKLTQALHSLLTDRVTIPSLQTLAATAGLETTEAQAYFRTKKLPYTQWASQELQRQYPSNIEGWLFAKFSHCKERAMERCGYDLTLREWQQLNHKIRLGLGTLLINQDRHHGQGQIYQVELNSQSFTVAYFNEKVCTFFHKGWIREQSGEYFNPPRRRAKDIRLSQKKNRPKKKIRQHEIIEEEEYFY